MRNLIYICVISTLLLLSTKSYSNEHVDASLQTVGSSGVRYPTISSIEVRSVMLKGAKVSSAKQAAARAKSKFSAKVLSVKASSNKQRNGYRVKMLSDKGVVFYVFVDAQSGRVSRV